MLSIIARRAASSAWLIITMGRSCFSSSSSSSVFHARISEKKHLLTKVKDHTFENLLHAEMKLEPVRRIIAMLLRRPDHRMEFLYMAGRGKAAGLERPLKITSLLHRHPRIFEIRAEDGKTWVKLSAPFSELLAEEEKLRKDMIPLVTTRLRKLLMMCPQRKLRFDRIEFLKADLGLPDDFLRSVVAKSPQHFRILPNNETDGIHPYIELVTWEPELAVPAIEIHRNKAAIEKKYDEELKKRFSYSFPLSYPTGFKPKKGFHTKQKLWQELLYSGPYKEFDNLNPRSPESIKRAVSIIHEYLYLTVEKRTSLSCFGHLREELMLPQKVGVTALEHPGIFYVSTKGGRFTVFLREAYDKGGELIDKDGLYLMKQKFMNLVGMQRQNYSREQRVAAAIARRRENSRNSQDEDASSIEP